MSGFLTVRQDAGTSSVTLDACTLTSNKGATAGALFVRPWTVLESIGTSWGDDPADNEPCDLVVGDPDSASVSAAYCDLGADEAFSCPGDGICVFP